MSIISLQFGQCGNQIGQALYSTIYEDICLNSKQKPSENSYYYQSVNKWFNLSDKGKFEPRSVLVDTEDKVVNNIKDLPFNFKNVVAKSYGGSANNWAYGYCSRSKLVSSQVLDFVRHEAEKCDYVTSLLNIYSSSGGTGSGVGSYIIEQLRDQFPTKAVVNAVVLPYVKGEIITQSYNTILNLAHLYNLSDSTILFENEKLHYMCKYAVNLSDINFCNINSVIAQQLASGLQPLNDVDNIYVMNRLCANPSYKFVVFKTEPNLKRENRNFEASKQWNSLIQGLVKQSRFDFLQQKECNLNVKTKYISNAIITRGSSSPKENDWKPFKNAKEYVSWLPQDEYFNQYNQKHNFLESDKFLTLISNTNNVCLPLNSIIEDAWTLFTHSAYLHHYKKYAVDEETFLNSFQILENILHNYKTV